MMSQVFNAQPTQTKLCYSESGWSCVVFLKLAGICHSIYPGTVQITKKTFVSKVFFTYCINIVIHYFLYFFPQSNWWVFFLRAFLQGHHYAFMCYIWKPQSEEFLCIHCPPSHLHSVLMTESLNIRLLIFLDCMHLVFTFTPFCCNPFFFLIKMPFIFYIFILKKSFRINQFRNDLEYILSILFCI